MKPNKPSLPGQTKEWELIEVERKRILYVGQLDRGGTAAMRCQALKDLGQEVAPINVSTDLVLARGKGIWPRICHKLGLPLDLADANSQMRTQCQKQTFDIIWLDKALTIERETLSWIQKKLPRAVIVGYSPDDMAAPHNQSRYFLKALPEYDIYFTTKTYNVPELLKLGARRVEFTANAYDPHTHRPTNLNESERAKYESEASFIGIFEKDRAEDMLYLASQEIGVRVFGYYWHRFRKRHSNLRIAGHAVLCEDYAKAVCGAAINLGFLRKLNRDQQTTRSVEIPACGAFMLAERTDEHQELFEMGKEAEFFSSRDELLEKAQYYLDHPQQRRRIAAAGRERCLKGGYSYAERLRKMLASVHELTKN